uniref:DUF1810 domain-containing protein n=1 Tax=Agathobacter sp. TaxID=2021311 RepID=UPI004055B9E1
MNYDLDRFITAQEHHYAGALEEMKAGFKCSHWMWYIFPQIKGLGHSAMAKRYEIVNLDEAKAYIENDYLRNNLIEISQALLDCGNDDIEDIMGFPDNFKLCSCMTLFELVAPKIDVFGKVLNKFFGGQRDKGTLELVK